jgi:hypothetical protein
MWVCVYAIFDERNFSLKECKIERVAATIDTGMNPT